MLELEAARAGAGQRIFLVGIAAVRIGAVDAQFACQGRVGRTRHGADEAGVERLQVEGGARLVGGDDQHAIIQALVIMAGIGRAHQVDAHTGIAAVGHHAHQVARQGQRVDGVAGQGVAGFVPALVLRDGANGHAVERQHGGAGRLRRQRRRAPERRAQQPLQDRIHRFILQCGRREGRRSAERRQPPRRRLVARKCSYPYNNVVKISMFVICLDCVVSLNVCRAACQMPVRKRRQC